MISELELRTEMQTTKFSDSRLTRLKNTIISQWETQIAMRMNKMTGYTDTFVMLDDTQTSFFVPLCNISSIVITEWQNSEVEADAETLEAADFEATPIKYPTLGYRVRKTSGTWNRNVRITCDLGWDDSDLPFQLGDIQDALLIQARFAFIRHSDSKVAVSSENSELGSTNFIKGPLHPQFAAAVKKYRWKL